jgi:fructokinase
MILICGEALIDLVPVVADGELAYAPRTGGSLYNVALGLGRLAVPVGFFGRVSTDPFGQLLRERLVSAGVDCTLLREGDEPTALAIVHLPPDHEPVFVFYGEGAADCTLTSDDLPSPEELGDAVTALHFGSISLVREPGATAYEQLLRREAGRRVISLDPNVRPSLISDRATYRRRLEAWVAMADIVKVSQADLAWLYPDRVPADAARDWLATGPSLVAVTRGAAGAVGITATGSIDVPGTPVRVRDTVGAGDAFTAGLLGFLALRGVLDRAALRFLGEEDLRPCLVGANRAASITCTRSGAQPPTRAEVLSEP